jgi:hypothetical protein
VASFCTSAPDSETEDDLADFENSTDEAVTVSTEPETDVESEAGLSPKATDRWGADLADASSTETASSPCSQGDARRNPVGDRTLRDASFPEFDERWKSRTLGEPHRGQPTANPASGDAMDWKRHPSGERLETSGIQPAVKT